MFDRCYKRLYKDWQLLCTPNGEKSNCERERERDVVCCMIFCATSTLFILRWPPHKSTIQRAQWLSAFLLALLTVSYIVLWATDCYKLLWVRSDMYWPTFFPLICINNVTITIAGCHKKDCIDGDDRGWLVYTTCLVSEVDEKWAESVPKVCYLWGGWKVGRKCA